MNANSMYKELVFYLEACESGSMFLKLPDNIHICEPHHRDCAQIATSLLLTLLP